MHVSIYAVHVCVDLCVQKEKKRRELYPDKQLSFGLRSAPLLFNDYADAFEWILRDNGLCNVIHYLDDFLIVGLPGSPECQQHLDLLLRLCDELGIPLVVDKIAGPSTSLSFLGILLDTTTMQACLPSDKLSRLSQELEIWQSKKSCTRKELEHLIGVLQFACKVVPQGRPFVRRMIDLLCVAQKPFHHIRLNKEFKSDLLWWSTYVETWNGISLLGLGSLLVPSLNVFSDASGGFGCGAVWGILWLQGHWPPDWAGVNIMHMAKELVPVVLAGAIWGSRWSGHYVCFHVDNLSVVVALKKGSSKEPSGIVMHLLRCLSFFSAHFQFTFSSVHVPGFCNGVADAISRNKLFDLPTQISGIQAIPSLIPPSSMGPPGPVKTRLDIG